MMSLSSTFPVRPPKQGRGAKTTAVALACALVLTGMISLDDTQAPSETTNVATVEPIQLRSMPLTIPTATQEPAQMASSNVEMIGQTSVLQPQEMRRTHNVTNDLAEMSPMLEENTITPPEPEHTATDDEGVAATHVRVVDADPVAIASYIQSGILMIEVVGAHGTYLSTDGQEFVRDAQMAADPRTGLRLQAPQTIKFETSIWQSLLDSGITDRPSDTNFVFTHDGLSRVMSLMGRTLDAYGQPRETADQFRLEICNTGTDIGLVALVNLATEQPISSGPSICSS